MLKSLEYVLTPEFDNANNLTIVPDVATTLLERLINFLSNLDIPPYSMISLFIFITPLSEIL